MNKIDTKCILLYLLLNRYDEMDFELLKEIEYKIFKYDPFMFIDFNQDTICSIIEQNPNIFEWSNNVIKKAKDIDKEYISLFCNTLNMSQLNKIEKLL